VREQRRRRSVAALASLGLYAYRSQRRAWTFVRSFGFSLMIADR